MHRSDCAVEPEVLEALQTSAWPDCCRDEIRTHVAECESCSGLVAVVLPLLDEHRIAIREAPVPTAAIVWWRSQLRARQEAERTAARPITIAQRVALATAAGLIAAAASLASPAARRFFAWVTEVAGNAAARAATTELPPIGWAEMQVLGPLGFAAIAALTTLLILAPLAIYLTAPDD